MPSQALPIYSNFQRSLASAVGLLGSMAKVHVCNVVVLDNPSHFKNPFQFEITFECIEVSWLQ